MMRPYAFLSAAAIVLFATSACSPQTPFKPVTTVKELMQATVEPTSDVVFDAAVWVNGEPFGVPKDDAEWEKVRQNALTLAESGNLLMMPTRAKDQLGWMTRSQALVDAGLAAAKAAETRNVETIFRAGGQIGLACDGCHQQYMGAEPPPTSGPTK
jgi:cytochrome c556